MISKTLQRKTCAGKRGTKGNTELEWKSKATKKDSVDNIREIGFYICDTWNIRTQAWTPGKQDRLNIACW